MGFGAEQEEPVLGSGLHSLTAASALIGITRTGRSGVEHSDAGANDAPDRPELPWVAPLRQLGLGRLAFRVVS